MRDAVLRVILWRHAKSAYPVGVPDIDRPLSDRGIRDAVAARTHLTRLTHGGSSRVLMSSSRRTLETWAWAGCAIRDARTEVDNSLYLASHDAIADLVAHEITSKESGPDFLIVLAHDPGLHRIVLDLAGNDQGADIVRSKFPTNALALFEVTLMNNEVSLSGRLIDIAIPRG